MDKDKRLYGRFTLDFADSPKIAPLSDAAFRALVEMTLHSRRMLDDGFVDERIALRKWKKKAIEELCTNDTVSPSVFKVDGGFRIHDFDEHQQTRADIEKKRTAGSKGGQASAQARASAHAEPLSKLITETESETSSSTKKTTTPASRGTRMTPGWTPPPDEIARAKSEYAQHVDLKAENEVFVDYWVAVAGARGVKTDWVATWRNWMKRKEGDRVQGRRSKEDQLVDVLEQGRMLMEQDTRKALE